LFSSVTERKPAVPINKDRDRNRQTNSRSRMSSSQSKENRQGNLSKSKRKGKKEKVNEEKVRSFFTLLSIKIIQGKIIILLPSKLFVEWDHEKKKRKEGNMTTKMKMKRNEKLFLFFNEKHDFDW
jgi:hypothetical protein